MDPRTAKVEKSKNKFNWKEFWGLLKQTHPQWRYLIPGLLLGIIGVVGNLATPKYASSLINSFKGTSMNKSLIGVVLAIFIGAAILSALGNFLLGIAGEQIVKNLRTAVWDKLIILKVHYFDETKSGEIISRLVNDTMQVKTLVANSLPSFITGVIQMVGAVVLMFVMDWHMAVWILVAIPAAAIVMVPVALLGNKVGRGTQDAMAAFSGESNQALSEIRLVKSSGSEEHELKRGHKQIFDLFKWGRKEAIVDGIGMPVMTMVMMGVFVLILVVGSLRVARGEMPSGDLLAFVMYLFQLLPPLMTLTTFFTTLAKTQGATERINGILHQETEDFESGVAVDVTGKEIVAEHVDFSYDDGEPILKDVSFVAKPNQVIAFAGPSGGGKSTTFSLLERYYEPTSGVIKIGDTDIKDVNLASWREQIGFVSQDSSIMAGTIRDNLTYGLDGDYSDEQLWHVLDLAYAKGFVEDMANGLNTEVGERGVKVSGGQRQRLAIARAFLRDPKILMLDEATASLDSESEAMVQKALESLMKDRTTLVIAHRLSTIVDADNIYFIEKGRVTGSGPHKELLDTHPLYRDYVSEQFIDKGEA
jgi:ATP-binding cassette subfamily B protein AbcA/BmrA